MRVPRLLPLSAHELEILRKFATGGSAPRIAKALGISPQTLRNHLHHINQKLRTHNRLEAVTMPSSATSSDPKSLDTGLAVLLHPSVISFPRRALAPA